MTTEEITEGNKLIAEFIGLEKRYIFEPKKEFIKECDITEENSTYIMSPEYPRFKLPQQIYWGIKEEYDKGWREDNDGCLLNKVTNEWKLQYHSSWDWLMPVVDKIESFDIIEIKIVTNNCYADQVKFPSEHMPNFHFNGDTKLKATYRFVIEFIKWYNTNSCNLFN